MTQYRYVKRLGRTLAQVKAAMPGWLLIEEITGGVLMFVKGAGR